MSEPPVYVQAHSHAAMNIHPQRKARLLRTVLYHCGARCVRTLYPLQNRYGVAYRTRLRRHIIGYVHPFRCVRR